jgi:hypothetical protein
MGDTPRIDVDALRACAEAVGIPAARRHILLCADQTKPKCSERADSVASWDYLKRRLKELGLSEALLHSRDGRGEVPVAGDHDSDVEFLTHAHHVDHQLDIEVGLDAPITVLADVLAHHLVAAAGEEGVELALVLILRIESGVGVGAHEVATSRG